ncbi:unnamed protein product [Cuscuta campestris]|uniref:Uncharacterized protein n=1 Tax=Cuscuta campestris TaxID=132261 RepID=A0A484MZH4_9ASTE|nr:unnamed protein product [Cuscuta campestris]
MQGHIKHKDGWPTAAGFYRSLFSSLEMSSTSTETWPLLSSLTGVRGKVLMDLGFRSFGFFSLTLAAGHSIRKKN